MPYCNNLRATFVEDEVHLDFAIETPRDTGAPQVNAQIIMPPKRFKWVLREMERMLREYEAKYGELPEPPLLVRPNSQTKIPGVN